MASRRERVSRARVRRPLGRVVAFAGVLAVVAGCGQSSEPAVTAGSAAGSPTPNPTASIPAPITEGGEDPYPALDCAPGEVVVESSGPVPSGVGGQEPRMAAAQVDATPMEAFQESPPGRQYLPDSGRTTVRSRTAPSATGAQRVVLQTKDSRGRVRGLTRVGERTVTLTTGERTIDWVVLNYAACIEQSGTPEAPSPALPPSERPTIPNPEDEPPQFDEPPTGG